MERLAGEVQHDRAVLADRVEHHRTLALGDGLAHDLDALGLEALEVGQRAGHGATVRQVAITVSASSGRQISTSGIHGSARL